MFKKKYRIVLLLNWKNRDMRGILQLKILLERMGHSVWVVSHGRMPLWNIYRIRPHLIVFPQVVAEVKMVKLAKKMGCKIAVLHSEGTVSTKKAEGFYYKKDIDVGEAVDLEMVWGPNMKKIMLENTALADKQIYIVGSPRFDIYRPPLSQLLMSRKEFCNKYQINLDNKIVVWTSNFVELERSKKQLEHRQTFGSADVKKAAVASRKLREMQVKAFIRMAIKYPDVNFMIKLHPLEVKDYYSKKLSESKVSNITLFKNEDIANVVNVCDVLLHRGSTSALEAGFLDKPTIFMMFKPEESYLSFCSDVVKNYEELCSKIEYYLFNHGKISDKIKKKPAKIYEHLVL